MAAKKRGRKQASAAADIALGDVLFGQAAQSIPTPQQAKTVTVPSTPRVQETVQAPSATPISQPTTTPTMATPSPIYGQPTMQTPTATTTTAAGTADAGNMQSDKTGESASQILSRILGSVGLSDLLPAIEPMWRNTSIPPNIDANQLGFMIRDSEPYAKRFPGNKALRDAGKPEYSVSEYLLLEKEYKNAIQGKGIPSGFYDTTEYIGQFIKNGVSVAEVGRRVEQGFRAVNEGDPEVLRQLKQFYPTVSDGELAAFFLAPEEARPIIVAKAQAAQVGAQAVKQAGMQLTTAEAESLIQQGIETPAEAQQVFGTIGAAQDLFQAQMIGEQAVAREEQLQFGVGNVQAQQRIAQRARRRKSEFEAGGGFATGQAGVAGLGTATR